MKYRSFILPLVVCLFISQTFAQQNSSQTPQTASPAFSEHAARIKQQLSKYKIGDKFTALLVDGREYYGALAELKSDEFVITEATTKQSITIKYDQVQKLVKGTSYIAPISGQRRNTRTVLIVTAITAAAVIIPLIIASSRRNQSPVFSR